MITPDQTTINFINEHESDDVRMLALQAKKYSDIDMSFAIQQIAGRQIAKHKIPTWYDNKSIVYPKHLSLEQCSSEYTAQYKANLTGGGVLLDLTGGLGVDFSFLAPKFKKAIYVEQNTDLTALAQHNLAVLGLDNCEVVNDDGVSFLENYNEVPDTIFIDPARRDGVGRKTVLIEDCTPNLIELDSLFNEKSRKVIIKLSPMLDITRSVRSISHVAEVHILSLNNECKELLLVKQKAENSPIIHCINIVTNNRIEKFSFTKEEEDNAIAPLTDTLSRYLYEPNTSIIKGGAYKWVAERFALKKLHINSHLYTSDTLLTDFPGRVFEIERYFSPTKKEINMHLKDIKQANVTTRNYPITVADIRKQTKLKDGGEYYIFATTLSNEKKVLILSKKVRV